MKKRLMIIDDEAGIRKGLEETLADTYDLLCAECAEDAWDMIFFFGEHVDLIITDIVLPGMDGLEFIKAIREINPWVPAIAMTGNSNHERAIKAANLNIGGYIQKPFNIELLRSKIEDLFKSYESASPFNVSPHLILKKPPSTLNPITIKTLREIHRNFHTHLTCTDTAASLGVSLRHMSRVFNDPNPDIDSGSYSGRQQDRLSCCNNISKTTNLLS